LVSAEERAGLMRATQYAHFTPEYIVRAMWAAVQRLGFAGGSVLEPGCGTGLFIAASPDEIAEKSYFTGIEADPITAKIAAQLYPESDLRHEDFTRAKLTGDYVSTAAEKCARWRRKSVPVGLIKKGPEALLIDARCEPREA